MTDIVESLRREVVWEPDVGDLLNAAADEIERLRKGGVCPHVRGTVTQHCSLNFTITVEEREAIYRAEARLRTAYVPDDKTAVTLRSLLERLK